MKASDQSPLIKLNPSLQRYYASLESRIGYWLLLGGTRHFGYYHADTYTPFPINGALRAMEDHLFSSLQLEPGAAVLDAGCGVGHVAIHLAQKGLQVTGIDVVDRHIHQGQRNIEARGLETAVTVRKMDYHNLEGIRDGSFDGIYTMETFVHATDPDRAVEEFFRVLRPGGSIALYEYDHGDLNGVPKAVKKSMDHVNKYASMPSNARFDEGVLQRMLEKTGFQDVVIEDLSANIMPMMRLFFIIAYIPYLFIRLLRLQAWFVNTVAGVEGYRGIKKNVWRYVAVTAKKPRERSYPSNNSTSTREGKKVR